MDPGFYALIAVVVVVYVVFVSWRVRVHRERRARAGRTSATRGYRGQSGTPGARDGADGDARLARALEAAARIAGEQDQLPEPAHPQQAAEPAPLPPPPSPPQHPPAEELGVLQPDATVAYLLSGIRLPADLAPLTTMASRAGAGDRVAFWTASAPAELTGPAMIDSLLAIGCTVGRLEPNMYRIERDGTRAMAVVHPDGRLATIDGVAAFPSLPENAVVIEIWLPA